MKDDLFYLKHILECIERIERYTEEGKEAFFKDTKTQDSVNRNLQTMGESVKRLSDDLKSSSDHIDWRAIIAFRNILVHDYLGIDSTQIWDIIEIDLRSLKLEISKLISQLNGEEYDDH